LDLLDGPQTDPGEDLRRTVAAGQLPGVDMDDALRRLGLPRDSIERMLLQFRRSQAASLTQLRAAWEDADAEQARRLAHSLAGASGNLSMHELRRLAKTVELAVKVGHGNVDGMLAELDQEAARVFGGLDMLENLRREKESGAPAASGESASMTARPGEIQAALEALVRQLDDGDLDSIQRAWKTVKDLRLPSVLLEPIAGLEALLAAFDHSAAARKARELAASLGT
jgi:HPt (histidine-containing phosphotransfer) domain-containing protein